jgi:hypothetical protein
MSEANHDGAATQPPAGIDQDKVELLVRRYLDEEVGKHREFAERTTKFGSLLVTLLVTVGTVVGTFLIGRSVAEIREEARAAAARVEEAAKATAEIAVVKWGVEGVLVDKLSGLAAMAVQAEGVQDGITSAVEAKLDEHVPKAVTAQIGSATLEDLVSAAVAGQVVCTEPQRLCRCGADTSGSPEGRVVVCLDICPDGRIVDFNIESFSLYKDRNAGCGSGFAMPTPVVRAELAAD